MRPPIDGRRATRDLARLYGSPPPGYDDALIAGGEEGVEGGAEKGTAKLTSCKDHSTKRLPSNWRGRTMAPFDFYKSVLSDMVVKGGTANACCRFHADRNRSLVVDLTGSKGVWTCSQCGQGDMIGFAMRLYNEGFVAAVRRLVPGVRQ